MRQRSISRQRKVKKEPIGRGMKVEWRVEEKVCVIKTQYAQISPRNIKISSFKLRSLVPVIKYGPDLPTVGILRPDLAFGG